MPVPGLKRNYVVEGQTRQACANANVLQSAIEDLIVEYQAGIFDHKNIEAHIEQMRTAKPHRWTIAGTENDELFVRAFGPSPTPAAQGEIVKQFGEKRAAEIAASFEAKLGSLKPGTTPATIKAKPPIDADHSKAPTNPWSAHPNNLDERGNYSAKALTQQSRLVASIGEVKSAEIAFAANGARLGDVRPKQKRVA